MMDRKRKVSDNSGRTQHRHANEIYNEIRKVHGNTKSCPFYGGSTYSGYGKNAHDQLNPTLPNPNVPIEEFDFLKKGEDWGLQGYCKVCYKVYRELRKQKARGQWTKADDSEMSDDEIRQWYRDNVGATMECSYGDHWKDPSEFRTSRNMEKGLHNICFSCEPLTRTAQGLREKEWLAGGDWDSWNQAAEQIRRQARVPCAGWHLSIQFGNCEGALAGENMHLDHIVPLRAGGIHDAVNLQAMCGTCNIKKSDQLNPDISVDEILERIHPDYHSIVNRTDSIPTIERKLKAHLATMVEASVQDGTYEQKLRDLKRRVNGQWDVERVVKKGQEWTEKQR
jgi:hypothetical protein